MSRHWFPFYHGDYLKDTQHLGPVEHGVYLMLMCHYYSSGKPLPANAMQLQRICKTFAGDEQLALQAVLDEFFDLHDNKYHHSRVDAELEKSKDISSKRSKAAKIRYEKEAANAMQVDTQPQSQPQKDLTTTSTGADGHEKVDNCPHDEVIALYHEHCPTLAPVRVWNEKRKRLLRSRWREDKKRQNIEWWKDYFRYVNTCPHLLGVNGWQATLEWLINESNLIKVIEGNYDKLDKTNE